MGVFMKMGWLRYVALGVICCPQIQAAISGTWVPTTGTNNWTVNANWNPNTGYPGTTPGGGDSATFPSTSAVQLVNIDRGFPLVLQSLAIQGNSGGGNYQIQPSLAGDSLTFLATSGNPSISNAGINSNTISSNILVSSATQTLQISSTSGSSAPLRLAGMIADSGGGLLLREVGG